MSLLEARWAVFMDLMGVKYKYEPVGGIVETGLREVDYLPDFEIIDWCYIEVKASALDQFVTDLAKTKAAAWCRYYGDVIFLCGFPLKGAKKMYSMEDSEVSRYSYFTYNWQECPRCGGVALTDSGMPPCGCYSEAEEDAMCNGGMPDMDFEKQPRLMKAYRLAKAFDFSGGASKVAALPFHASLI